MLRRPFEDFERVLGLVRDFDAGRRDPEELRAREPPFPLDLLPLDALLCLELPPLR